MNVTNRKTNENQLVLSPPWSTMTGALIGKDITILVTILTAAVLIMTQSLQCAELTIRIDEDSMLQWICSIRFFMTIKMEMFQSE